jgi:uncharacterized iron-regulated membrane protein
MGKRVYRFWVSAHKWLGLTIGLVLVVVSLSGSLLALSGPLLRFEFGELLFPRGLDTGFMARTEASELPLDSWVERALTRHPELGSAEVVASPGSVPFPVDVVMLAGGMSDEFAQGKERHVVVALDPTTGETLGSFTLENSFVGNLLAFHATLLGGIPGIILVVVTGFIALLSLGSGLYLWWPRGTTWSRALRLNTRWTGRPWLLSLHAIPAAWLFIPLAVVLLSGSYLLTPDLYDRSIGALVQVRQYQEPAVAKPAAECGADIGANAAVAAALQVHPGQALRLLTKPEDACYPYIVSLMPIGTTNTRAAYTEVWVARDAGAILASRRNDELSVAERITSWLAPLHRDLTVGVLGSILVALTGVLIAALYTTGFLAWLRQRGARSAASARQQTAPRE